MKKKIACEIDCADCAAKLQETLRGIEGEEDATVNFFTRKLTLSAADDRFESVLAEVVKTVKRLHPEALSTL